MPTLEGCRKDCCNPKVGTVVCVGELAYVRIDRVDAANKPPHLIVEGQLVNVSIRSAKLEGVWNVIRRRDFAIVPVARFMWGASGLSERVVPEEEQVMLVLAGTIRL